MGQRIEINGLFKTDRGRTCQTHTNGCGLHLKVGDIIIFKKECLEFTEEVFTASRQEELKGLQKKELLEICQINVIKVKANSTKAIIIDNILIHEGEQFGAEEQQIQTKKWTEVALKANLLNGGCTVGFLGRASPFNLYSVNFSFNQTSSAG